MNLLTATALLLAVAKVCNAGELTFELPDNEKMCFHEEIDKSVQTNLEFQVRTVR